MVHDNRFLLQRYHIPQIKPFSDNERYQPNAICCNHNEKSFSFSFRQTFFNYSLFMVQLKSQKKKQHLSLKAFSNKQRGYRQLNL